MADSPDADWAQTLGPEENIQMPQFLEAISRADGTMVVLPGVPSRTGEALFISARMGPSLSNFLDEDEILLVDVFAEDRTTKKLIPVGHYDWVIKGKSALGNKQRHDRLDCPHEAQDAARRKWTTGEAFKVDDVKIMDHALVRGGFPKMSEYRQQGIIADEDQWGEKVYQRLGIGSLMLAVSAYVLQSRGIREVNVGTLSPFAQGVWARFGRTDEQTFDPTELVKHPRTGAIIEKFITPT